eukprot:15446036-Alexandrium_andersonii.AAC.1
MTCEAVRRSVGACGLEEGSASGRKAWQREFAIGCCNCGLPGLTVPGTVCWAPISPDRRIRRFPDVRAPRSDRVPTPLSERRAPFVRSSADFDFRIQNSDFRIQNIANLFLVALPWPSPWAAA